MAATESPVVQKEGHSLSRLTAIVAGAGAMPLSAPASRPAAAQVTAAPGNPPVIEGSFRARNSATASCQNALAAQNPGGVRVVGSESSEAAHAVHMRAGANGAAWRCLVGAAASNPSTLFMGSEGFL